MSIFILAVSMACAFALSASAPLRAEESVKINRDFRHMRRFTQCVTVLCN